MVYKTMSYCLVCGHNTHFVIRRMQTVDSSKMNTFLFELVLFSAEGIEIEHLQQFSILQWLTRFPKEENNWCHPKWQPWVGAPTIQPCSHVTEIYPKTFPAEGLAFGHLKTNERKVISNLDHPSSWNLLQTELDLVNKSVLRLNPSIQVTVPLFQSLVPGSCHQNHEVVNSSW